MSRQKRRTPRKSAPPVLPQPSAAPAPSPVSLPAGRALPTLSVVVPADQERAALQRTLQALLADATPQLEVIVAGEGASGEPALSAQAAGAGRLQVIPLEHASAAAACNAALAAATGEYVGFAAAGAQLHPGWAQALLAAAASRPAIVRGEVRALQEGREPPVPPCAFMARHTPLHWFGCAGAAIYRRDFVQDHGLQFREEFHPAGADFQVQAVVSLLLSHERMALCPQAVCRLSGEAPPAAGYSRHAVACSMQGYAALHELLQQQAAALPPQGLGFQYHALLTRVFALARHAAYPQDGAAAAALAQRLCLECPCPDELEQERLAHEYAVPPELRRRQ